MVPATGACAPVSVIAPDCDVIEVVPAFTWMPSKVPPAVALAMLPVTVIAPLVLPIKLVPVEKLTPWKALPLQLWPSRRILPLVVAIVAPSNRSPLSLAAPTLPYRLMLPAPALRLVPPSR